MEKNDIYKQRKLTDMFTIKEKNMNSQDEQEIEEAAGNCEDDDIQVTNTKAFNMAPALEVKNNIFTVPCLNFSLYNFSPCVVFHLFVRTRDHVILKFFTLCMYWYFSMVRTSDKILIKA